MGTTTPKSEREQAYRDLVSAWLRRVMELHHLNKTELGAALGRDRATASRYVAGKVSAPLQQLQHLTRSKNIPVPRDVEDAFWAAQADTTEDPMRKSA